MSLAIPETLSTERLRLRHGTAADADSLHSWQSDPEVTRYLPYGPRSREQVTDLLARLIRTRQLENDGDRIVFAVELVSDERVVGELHLVLRDSSAPECELGWVFAPDVAGWGYATEASRVVLESAFATGAHRVIADLDPRNAASARLCARLGMRQEAHFVKNWRNPDGQWEDTAVWAILNPDGG